MIIMLLRREKRGYLVNRERLFEFDVLAGGIHSAVWQMFDNICHVLLCPPSAMMFLFLFRFCVTFETRNHFLCAW